MTYDVSIHAPARGATKMSELAGWVKEFQSTRPRGARLASANGQSDPRRFNPRARAGRDWYSVFGQNKVAGFNPRARAGRDVTVHFVFGQVQVSIHAPARGATV